MSDGENEQPTQGRVLGRIQSDTEPPQSDQPQSRLKIAPRKHSTPEPGRLPKGAWLQLVISGGMVFRTTELIVFSDQRLTYRSSPTAVTGQTLMVRQLLDAQFEELQQLASQIDFAERTPGTGRQSPDTIVYELAIRINRRTQSAEVSRWRMPEPFANLVHRLAELSRISADETNDLPDSQG